MMSDAIKRFVEPRRTELVCLFLVAATMGVYLQTASFEFTNYDEHFMILTNPAVRSGLTSRSIGWALTANWFDAWHPLTWLSHMLDVQLFGLNAGGHHLMNVGFHIANTLLLFGLLRRMTGAFWRSATVAAFFALHPLHVESVAWVAERKDTLSGMFFLLTLWAYANYAGALGLRTTDHGPRTADSAAPRAGQDAGFWYVMALILFGCGLMSKPMLVTLPFVLLLLDFWPLQRVSCRSRRKEALKLGGAGDAKGPPYVGSYNAGSYNVVRLLLEKVPFFLLSLGSCLITYSGMRAEGNILTGEKISWGLRLANVPVSYARYLGKTFWPGGMHPLYPMPVHLGFWEVGAALLLLAAITAFGLLWLRTAPWLATGWLLFLGTLVPVIGVVAMNKQAICDRYTYLPHIGLFVALVWGAAELAGRWRLRPAVLAAVGVLLVTACGILAWRQAGYWRNSSTLWTHCLELEPTSAAGHYGLAADSRERGKVPEAIDEYKTALRFNPEHLEANFDLGLALLDSGRATEASNYLTKAVSINPSYAKGRLNLGLAMQMLKDYPGAEAQFTESIRLSPAPFEAWFSMARLLSAEGKSDEALRYFAEAMKRNRLFPPLHYYLGLERVKRHEYGQAVPCLTEAVRLAPAWKEAQDELTRAIASRDAGERSGSP
jgi:Tfp pilus assembly protein PilF